jgi:hypothetical protein
VPCAQVAVCDDGQADLTVVPIVLGVDEAEKVPAPQGVHVRSTVVVAAAA